MMKRKTSFFFLACLMVLPLLATASQSFRDSNINFRRVTPSEGLPASNVRCIAQDQQGFIWFATEDGLAKYDGYKCLVFRHDDQKPTSLADNVVWDIKHAPKGNLWVGTASGLDLWDHQTENFVHFPLFKNANSHLINNPIRQILYFNENTNSILLGVENAGLLRLQLSDGKIEQLLKPQRDGVLPGANIIQFLYSDREGHIWICTYGQGLIRYDTKTSQFTTWLHDPKQVNSICCNEVNSVAEDAEANLWIGTRKGLCKMNPDRTRIEAVNLGLQFPGSPDPPIIETLKIDVSGTVWIGTDGGGIYRWDRSQKAPFHYFYDPFNPHSLRTDAISHIFIDRDNDTWIAHTPNGVSFASPYTSAFRLYRSKPGQTNSLSHNAVACFLEDPKGNLWIGTDGGGLNYFDQKTEQWKCYRNQPGNSNSLSSDFAITLERDHTGQLWIGTWNGGLNRFNPASEKFQHYFPEIGNSNSLSSPNVWRILEDQQKRLWVATFQGGLCRYLPDQDRFVQYTNSPSNPRSINHNNVWCLLCTRKGNIWAGTFAGLARWEPASDSWQRFQHNNSPDSLSDDWVVDLLEDREGNIWIATFRGGLNRFDPKTEKFERFCAPDILPSNVVAGILEDDAGFLWISTNEGLARLDPRTRKVHFFDTADGLQGQQFSRNARLRLSTGELLFGGPDGFNRLNTKALLLDTNEPPVIFTHLEIMGRPVIPDPKSAILKHCISETTLLKIPAQYPVIGFRFAALSYRFPHRTRCYFKLEGFDEDWRDAGTERHATYTNLDPGRYRLKIQPAGRERKTNIEGTFLDLEITPPWWKTRWFVILSTSMVLGAIVFTTQSVSARGLKRRLREVEREKQLEKERRHAAELLHESEESQKSLQAQLIQAQKMEAIGQLAGGIAHDFNNILSATMMNLNLLQQKSNNDAETIQALQELESDAKRAASLTRQLLQFSRRSVLQLKVQDLNEVISHGLNILKRLIGEQIKLIFLPGKDLNSVEVDAAMMDQVLMNLVVNARDAMPKGGQITIATKQVDISDEMASHNPEIRPGRFICISVADNGIGMDETTLKKIFQPFFTTKDVGKGTGLGLATVYGIVTQHKGWISVQSQVGQGSTFSIYVPATLRASVPEHNQENISVKSGNERILIVEDDENVRRVAVQSIRRLGYQVIEASNGPEALTLWRQFDGKIDLLFTDMVMPEGMSGLDLMDNLRRENPSLKVIISSGYSPEAVGSNISSRHDVMFLPKPYVASSLGQAIRKCLESTRQPTSTRN